MKKEEWQKKGAGHRARLRDKFLENGIDSLTDTELIEILLTFATPRSDCKEQARTLLKKFGSLSAVLDADSDQLVQIDGVGIKNIFGIRFVPEVARRYLKRKITQKQLIRSSKDVKEYLLATLVPLKKEVFVVVFLDSQHAIIESETVCEGTINVNTVYPREVVQRALFHNAAAIIVAHNHPSGSLKRSIQDDKLTKTLHMTCKLMQIRLLDHLIIGDGVFSYADNGLMDTIAEQTSEQLA